MSSQLRSSSRKKMSCPATDRGLLLPWGSKEQPSFCQGWINLHVNGWSKWTTDQLIESIAVETEEKDMGNPISAKTVLFFPETLEKTTTAMTPAARRISGPADQPKIRLSYLSSGKLRPDSPYFAVWAVDPHLPYHTSISKLPQGTAGLSFSDLLVVSRTGCWVSVASRLDIFCCWWSENCGNVKTKCLYNTKEV